MYKFDKNGLGYIFWRFLHYITHVVKIEIVDAFAPMYFHNGQDDSRPGCPGWAYFRLLGDCASWSFFEKYISSPNILVMDSFHNKIFT
jgi:hypothetical protein